MKGEDDPGVAAGKQSYQLYLVCKAALQSNCTVTALYISDLLLQNKQKQHIYYLEGGVKEEFPSILLFN